MLEGNVIFGKLNQSNREAKERYVIPTKDVEKTLEIVFSLESVVIEIMNKGAAIVLHKLLGEKVAGFGVEVPMRGLKTRRRQSDNEGF